MPLKQPSGMQASRSAEFSKPPLKLTALKADLSSFAAVLHVAAALVDGKNNPIPAIANFFNQPFVVGVGIILFYIAKAERNIDKKN